ncbi:hypothetical protein KSF_089910 [Reticulibacter mediterranei]|uniref:DUF3592 domain-containing protein n=1 Tax=Reticulibacter mediterranei TaxID=2778369 RepID=A0A8J3IRF8_9CHLR|nr:DUF3592 domain-containing protein [Reticulibacter mediterranei]GHO98943.1 hypothetical protein KSF_089910 [Reticulibacter mediterranei]
MKRLGSLSLVAGFGLFAGSMLTLLLLWWFIYALWRIAQLSETGTQVMATVAQVRTREATSLTYENHAFNRAPVTIHQLVARWQNPQTGKTYVFKTPVRNPDKFPVGSSVPFLIDPKNPKWWHRLQDLQNV